MNKNYPPKIIVMGYHNIGYVLLKELIEMKENVIALITHFDDPNENIWFNSVRELAFENYIPVYQPRDVNDRRFVEVLRRLCPDIIFSFFFRKVLCEDILKIPKIGSFNMHASLLPKYRGRAPINWVLINGEEETGVTLHYMGKEPDKGDIVGQKKVKIDFEDTAYTLFQKCVEASVELFREVFPQIKENRVKRIPQDNSLSTYFGGRKPDDGIINWNQDAIKIYNLIRAVTHPYPGAFTFLNREKLFVWKAKVCGEDINSEKNTPGEILDVREDAILVKTGKGIIKIEEAQFEGEDKVNGQELQRKFKKYSGSKFGLRGE